MRLGFIGVGVMGQPMAINLAKSGPVTIWNRSSDRTEPLRAAGARIAATSDELFQTTDVVILMLANEAAIDSVLGRGTQQFSARVSNHTIVHMGTTSPGYSHGLEKDIRAAGGSYVEAPVSGSRKPAEEGRLVAMLAGEQSSVDLIRPILKPMCHETFPCGPVPNALLMKLAVNLFLIATVTGLAEAFHFAEQHQLDLPLFRSVLDAGQMASSISKVKIAKLVTSDFAVQASISDVLKNNQLIADAAREAGLASPLLDVCHALFAETVALGHGKLDMAAVVRAIEERSNSIE